MDIVFNPAIGDSIPLETSLTSKTAILHFTAELTAHDHNQLLIQDHARIQLWSDIPHTDGQSLSEGGWSALDFTYKTQATKERSSSHKILLGSPIHPTEDKITLFLQVIVALPVNHIPPFSFTYRIVYSSGDIQWLGAFGQNGLLLFKRSDSDLQNLGLDSWTFDKSRMARIYEIKQPVAALGVARVRNVYNYCVRAIGPTRYYLSILNIYPQNHLTIHLSFLSDAKEASLLFLVPRLQPSTVSLLPTYVLSASPGASLTLSEDGHITASGSGTLLFQVNEGHLKSLAFIRQVLLHAGLDGWNVLGDADSTAVVLATPKDKFPIKAITVPLWHSEHFVRPIHLETTTLSNILGSTEFSIFSPDNMGIHLFTINPQESQNHQMISLESRNIGNDLVISPIYTLRDYQSSADKPTIIWKTTIISPYQIQDSPLDDSGILPTPPPSPHLQPIAHLSEVHASSVTSDICTEPETPSSPPINPADASPIQQETPPIPRSILTMLLSLLYFVFFNSLYGLLWGHRTFGPPGCNNTTEDHAQPQSEISTGPEDDVPDSPEEKNHASESLTKNSLRDNLETQTTQVQPSQSCGEIPEAITGLELDSTKGGRHVCYIQRDPRDPGSKKTPATTVALLCMTHNDSSMAEDTTYPNTSNAIDKDGIMKRCVQFLDGSEPECTVNRCNVDVCYDEKPGSGGSYSCCLLQYQLDWDSNLEKSGKTIRISPPSIDT